MLTHSTHADGLIPALQILTPLPNLRTITPARLATSRCGTSGLLLKVSTVTPSGAKLLCRRGTQVQEVFMTFARPRVPSAASRREGAHAATESEACAPDVDLEWLQREIDSRLK